ncbi:protein PYRICULARIA ORYZAE RESISTANCE 21 [Heracleum sosnowskyi]|uniref:Protein PYRICULARIA ORYZAE RESISTANCE 21 n=1 Tax=Heracleum sosnowskyi TaxID=360622 RepID=A0AAD8LUL5_9APIA|nr:protein PYRICULARIA ORYZAE RESISTANCE 21 [Heracleum sosnowskyi]
MAEKVTIMVLNTVDLECSCCYKKVKKVLCKFPQIRDQVYDVKNSKVTIKVLCCNPEKIRDKLCCKGGKVIKSIQIVDDPPKPKAPEKPKEAEKPKVPEKPKEAEKPKAPEKPKEAEKPKAPEKPKDAAAKPKAPEKPKEAEKPKPPAEKPKPPAEKPKVPEGHLPHMGAPVQGHPPIPMYPNGTCCGSCSQGYGGGPCYQGYGRPVPPPPGPCYDYGYGYRGSKCCVSTDYFSEENPQGCTIM